MRGMKRPLCLAGTLALAAGLAAPAGVDPMTERGDTMGAELADGPLAAVPLVPVPPADGSGHRPHPSYRSLSGLDRSSMTTEGRGHRHRRQDRQDRRRLYHSPTGIFKNLVLLLRFSDHADRTLPSQADIHKLYNSESFDLSSLSPGGSHHPDGVPTEGLSSAEDVAPTGSVRQVYLSNSHGAFTVDTAVVDWISLNNTEEYYAAGNHGFSKFKEAIAEALTHLDSTGFDFSAFDLDENAALDGFGVLHSGHGAEFGGDDCHGAQNEHRIWSHKGGLSWTSAPAADGDAVRANRYYVSSALRGKCHSKIVRMGVICHELGHYLGLPDLYDGTFDGTGLGAYDFMSQSWGWDGSGLYPPNLSAWSKLEVGWATAQTIEHDGYYELDAGGVYKISEGFPSGEYLLLENRQASGYDVKLAAGGIAVYHVDEEANGQKERGYPGQATDEGAWPANGAHYQVALLGADGQYDLERGENQGDGTDLWHAGNSRSELKGGIEYPNTDAYQGGVVVSTGIRIYNFSASGGVMSFNVEGLGAPPTGSPTKQPTKAPTPQPSKAPVTPSPTAPPTASPSHDALASYASSAEVPQGQQETSVNGWVPVQVDDAFPEPSDDYSFSTPQGTAPPTAGPSLDALASSVEILSPQEQGIVQASGYGYPQHNGLGGPVIVSLPETLPEPREPQAPEVDPAVGSMVHYHHSALDGMTNPWQSGGWSASDSGPEVLIQPQEEEGADIVTLSVPVGDPTLPPSSEPTEDPLGAAPVDLASLGFHPGGSAEAAAKAGCPYYPGWNLGVSHCLNDCHQPSYMLGKSIFEFAALDECCDRHFQGAPSCREQSLLAELQRESAAMGFPSVGGRVWEDANGNHRRESQEGGVAGALMDLYHCSGDDPWVQGQRTGADGSYAFDEVGVGRYFVQITVPEGYHLPRDDWRRDAEHDSDFGAAAGGLGRSECFELENGGADVSLDAGLIPGGTGGDSWTAAMEQVSAASPAAPTSEGVTGHSASQFVVHSKSGNSGQGDAPKPPTPSTLMHSKSGLRGSVASSFESLNSYEASDASMVAVNPTDDATVHSDESMLYTGGIGELRVGPNHHWQDDALLKFDVGGYGSATKAVLRLYSLSSSPTGGKVFAGSSNSWDEDSVTWSSAPDMGAELAVIGKVQPNHWTEVDVTGALDPAGGSVTLRIASEEGNHSFAARYASKESGEHPAPELRIYF